MQGKKEILSLILEARKRTALSQVQFAQLLGCSHITVLRYENGQRPVAKSYFEKCKNLLKTPVSELGFLLEAFHNPKIYFDYKNTPILKLPSAC